MGIGEKKRENGKEGEGDDNERWRVRGEYGQPSLGSMNHFYGNGERNDKRGRHKSENGMMLPQLMVSLTPKEGKDSS